MELTELLAEIFPVTIFLVAVLNSHARVNVFPRAGLHQSIFQFVRGNPEVIEGQVSCLFKGFDNRMVFTYAVFVYKPGQIVSEGLKMVAG